MFHFDHQLGHVMGDITEKQLRFVKYMRLFSVHPFLQSQLRSVRLLRFYRQEPNNDYGWGFLSGRALFTLFMVLLEFADRDAVFKICPKFC